LGKGALAVNEFGLTTNEIAAFVALAFLLAMILALLIR
jgi:hypothetical protein